MTLADLPESIIGALRAHVARAYPEEGCGVILHGPRGYDAILCENAARDRAHHFAVAKRDLVQIALRMKSGYRIAAIFHSHSDTPAIFSDEDRHYAAAWPDALHLVFAVTKHGVIAQHAYDAQGTRVDEPVLESA